MRPQTAGAIALKPDDTATGSWKYWLLRGWAQVHRQSWAALPMPVEVIDYINAKNKSEKGSIDTTLPLRIGHQDLADPVDEADVPMPIPSTVGSDRVPPMRHVLPDCNPEKPAEVRPLEKEAVKSDQFFNGHLRPMSQSPTPTVLGALTGYPHTTNPTQKLTAYMV
jgi:hypothetical protein